MHKHSNVLLLLLVFSRLLVLPVLIKEKHLMLKQTITSHFVCFTFEFSLLILNTKIHTRHSPLRYAPIQISRKKKASTLYNHQFRSSSLRFLYPKLVFFVSLFVPFWILNVFLCIYRLYISRAYLEPKLNYFRHFIRK